MKRGVGGGKGDRLRVCVCVGGVLGDGWERGGRGLGRREAEARTSRCLATTHACRRVTLRAGLSACVCVCDFTVPLFWSLRA